MRYMKPGVKKQAQIEEARANYVLVDIIDNKMGSLSKDDLFRMLRGSGFNPESEEYYVQFKMTIRS